MSEQNKKIKTMSGIVASDKMNKTIVVEVSRMRIHPRYKKRYRTSKRYKVHDEKNEYKVGDKVIIKETRPLSRGKRWVILPQNRHENENTEQTQNINSES